MFVGGEGRGWLMSQFINWPGLGAGGKARQEAMLADTVLTWVDADAATSWMVSPLAAKTSSMAWKEGPMVPGFKVQVVHDNDSIALQ